MGRLFPVRFVGNQDFASGVFGDQLNGVLGKGCRKWNRYRANSHCAKQGEYPLRHVFHQNADVVAALNTFGDERSREFIGPIEHIRVPVLLYLVLLIDNEGDSIRRAARPLLDLIEDPIRSELLTSRSCNFGAKGHTVL